jgi:hypothetical protein
VLGLCGARRSGRPTCLRGLRARRGGLGFGGPGIVGRGLRTPGGGTGPTGGAAFRLRLDGGRGSGRLTWLWCRGFGREAEGFAHGGFEFFNGGDFGLGLLRLGFGPEGELMGDGLGAVVLEVQPVFALGGFDFGLFPDESEAAFVEVGHPVALLQSLEADQSGGVNVPEGFGADEADAEADHFIEVGGGGGVIEGGGQSYKLFEVVVEFLAEGFAAVVVPLAETGKGAGADCDVVGFEDVGDDVLLGPGLEAGDDLFLAFPGEHAQWGIGAGFSLCVQVVFGPPFVFQHGFSGFGVVGFHVSLVSCQLSVVRTPDV